MLKLLCAALVGAMLITIAPAHAQPKPMSGHPFLHPLFSSNAVLQRDRALTIWGWAKAGERVSVKFDGAPQTVVAAPDGRWSAPLAPHAAGGNYVLEVTGANGETSKSQNLTFGDLWLCSGQSNMGRPVSAANDAPAAIAAAAHPQIRLMRVPRLIENAPIEAAPGASWQVCSPATVPNFSAVGYYFGRKLQDELKIPIGLIDSSWGGTPAESWVSAEALAPLGDFEGAVAAMRARASDPANYATRRAAWWQSDPGTKAGWNAANFDDAAWKTMSVPGAWEESGLPGFDGVMWFRRDIEVPAAWAGHDLELGLNRVDDDDATFWNGAVVGETRGYGNVRHYVVPGALVKAGRNSIAIRVLDTGGPGGLRESLSLKLAGGDEEVSLNGAWKLRPGAKLSEMPPLPQDTDQNTPTSLYNGMIAPLLPGQIKGAIWYQGESNAGRAAQYQKLLPALIGDWRARFGGPLPFYIVQLAGFMAPDETPRDDAWPRLREAQDLTAKKVPRSGLAVITDIGEQDDIHPKNKRDVGLRLALLALKGTYGVNVEASGPTLQSARVAGGEIVLRFDHAAGLKLQGEADRVFALAGADGQFFWAGPTIQGNSIYISTPNVPAPLYARFAWSNNPRASLYNAAGLPAAPFRTDAD